MKIVIIWTNLKKFYGNQYQEELENRYSHEPNLFLWHKHARNFTYNKIKTNNKVGKILKSSR
jgi:hypothetical protein